MATYSRQLLSASTNGRPIKVAATASAGTTIHTAVSGTSSYDEIWLWATNTDSAERTITVEWGGTSNPDDRIVNAYTLPANSSPIALIEGVCLQNSLIVKAFASSANVVLITGHVNRIA